MIQSLQSISMPKRPKLIRLNKTPRQRPKNPNPIVIHRLDHLLQKRLVIDRSLEI